MAAMPQIIPVEVADYHVSRQRCSRAAKRARKRTQKGTASGDVAVAEQDEQKVPYRPEVLDHLVLGLNETTKELDRSIADLRLRMAVLADALGASSDTPRFLPTAPSPAVTTPEESPLVFLLVPHTSVSPFSLIEDLATTVATHNTLLRQHSQLRKATHAPQFSHLAHLAKEIPEIRLVPLGRREEELAAAAGLRRLANFAVRASHPALPVLERLLPTSLLHPPRHSITLPWPSMNLSVVNGTEAESVTKKKDTHGEEKEATQSTPKGETTLVPPIEYAALHIKGVHTTAPADPTARKARRLAEVRAKRVETKMKKLVARKKMEQGVIDDIKRHASKGRAARLAAKKGKAAETSSAVPVPV